MSSWYSQRVGGTLAAILLTACADPTGSSPAASGAPSRSQAPAGGQAPASVEWNGIARDAVARNRSNVFVAFRTYATVSVAQLEAVRAAEQGSSHGDKASRRAAVAAASAVALCYVYPADCTTFEGFVRDQVASEGWLERDGIDAETGEAMGRAAGAAVVERAKTDGYFDPWAGTAPTGPGIWSTSTTPPTAPTGAALGDARTFFLTSGGQFRPPPPPAFGSPEFTAALAEVRQISDTRTPAQDSIARFWGMGAGSFTPPGYWNLEASTLALRYSLNERRAARLLALLNMVAMDAIIASHEAKYFYWLIRPSQADPAITLSLPLPNFPAYPSNHATISAAMAEVLAAAFPSHADRLRAAADEAALSRVYGGIHYRFDGTAGLTLGRQVARWALEQGANVHNPYPVPPGLDQ
jgi:membrane-associated phospholipid phosphatase